MVLLAGRLEQVITSDQGHCATQGFEIIATTAGGAGVHAQVRVPLAEGVPVGQLALNVMVFSRPLAIRSIGTAPKCEGIHVEILTIEIDALFGQCPINMVDKPVQGLRMAEIQQAAGATAKASTLRWGWNLPLFRKQPFGMILSDP